MISQLDLKSLSPAVMSSCARIGSDIAVATYSGFPYPTLDLHAYSWNGTNLTYVTGAGGAGYGPGGKIVCLGGYIYAPAAVVTYEGVALLLRFIYDGMTISIVDAAYFGGGPGGMGSGSSVGDAATDSTYLYCPANTYVWVGPPPQVAAVRMHAVNKTTMAVVGTPLNIAATGYRNPVIAQGGAVFYTYGSGATSSIRKLTFNGSTFSVAGTVTNANIDPIKIVGDGTYLYVGHSDNHSILVYNNSLGLVTTFDTTFTSNVPSCAGGNVYVGSSSGTRIYTFDGANFALQDIMPTQNISNILV